MIKAIARMVTLTGVLVTSAVVGPYSYADALNDLTILSADDMAGRAPGTAGSSNARNYIAARFFSCGLQPFNGDFFSSFEYEKGARIRQGVNVVAMVRGRRFPEQFIVLSAHYDHLGTRGQRVFNGADDNASGVAALLAIATQTQVTPPDVSLIFLATDAEEQGLFGAKAFVTSLPVSRNQILLNINMDMIGHGGRSHELILLPSVHEPQLKAFVQRFAKNHSDGAVTIRTGQRLSARSSATGESAINWRRASDHAVFHRQGIPYIYAGTAPRPYYHTSDDILENIDQPFYISVVSKLEQLVLGDMHGLIYSLKDVKELTNPH